MKNVNHKVLLICSFTLSIQCCPLWADDSVSPEPSTNATKALQPSDPETRIQLAKQLAIEHDANSFRILLNLLKDSISGVSYAAAGAIEHRGDKQFDKELIEAIKVLPKENLWPAYRAEKSYPTKQTVNFLLERLQAEIDSPDAKNHFDERNSFYIASSLESISKFFPELNGIKTPTENTLSAYKLFQADVQRRLKR